MDYYKWFEDKHRELEASGTWTDGRIFMPYWPQTAYCRQMDGRYVGASFTLWPGIAMEASASHVRDSEPNFYLREVTSTDEESLVAFWREFYDVILKAELAG